MKKMFLYCVSSVLLQNIYCASDEKKALSFPSEISAHVDYEYKKHLIRVFESLDPQQQNQRFFSRDASQAYIAFLNDGPRNVMDKFPELVKRADMLQQDIFANETSAAVALLVENASEGRKDSIFWECLHASLRITLKDKAKGIIIYPTDLETLEQNEVTTEDSKVRWSEERQPDFMGALIVMIRMMELNHQQNPDALEALLKKLS